LPISDSYPPFVVRDVLISSFDGCVLLSCDLFFLRNEDTSKNDVTDVIVAKTIDKEEAIGGDIVDECIVFK